MLRLLFSIVRNVSCVSQVTRIGLWGCFLNVIVTVCFGHVMSSQRSQFSRIVLRGCSLNVFGIVFVIVFSFVQVMSPYHTDQVSQRSHVSWVALWRSSLKVFVIVFVIVFVFVSVFLLVMSCLLITLITSPNGHKSLRVLYGSVFQQWLVVSQLLSDKVTYRAVWGQLKKLDFAEFSDWRKRRRGISVSSNTLWRFHPSPSSSPPSYYLSTCGAPPRQRAAVRGVHMGGSDWGVHWLIWVSPVHMGVRCPGGSTTPLTHTPHSAQINPSLATLLRQFSRLVSDF